MGTSGGLLNNLRLSMMTHRQSRLKSLSKTRMCCRKINKNAQ
jgi:hypothetical protein